MIINISFLFLCYYKAKSSLISEEKDHIKTVLLKSQKQCFPGLHFIYPVNYEIHCNEKQTLKTKGLIFIFSHISLFILGNNLYTHLTIFHMLTTAVFR